MNEAPKKIWIKEDDDEWWGVKPSYGNNTQYIRADLVDGLVKGLASGDYRQYCTCEECKKVTETLKALEEE